jgi:hypothetical protein
MVWLVITLGLFFLIGLSLCAAGGRADESTERAMRAWPPFPSAPPRTVRRDMPFSLN